MKKIDITEIAVQDKHKVIFEVFDTLDVGGSLVIHNDHDPKPLYYFIKEEKGDVLDWRYLKEGPSLWTVKITRTAQDVVMETVGEMVAKDYRTAEVFQKYGIDFCCGGKKSLALACEEKSIDRVLLEAELKRLEGQAYDWGRDFDNWNLDFLVDYIVNVHHRYVKGAVPVLLDFTQKVAEAHGRSYPRAVGVASIFKELAQELDTHLQKEENILFPYVKAMVKAASEQSKPALPPFLSAQNPIRVMESEHDDAGALMKKIRELTDDFTCPEGVCTTFKATYGKLEEFEKDLHQHVHLENNILFPKVVSLEQRLLG